MASGIGFSIQENCLYLFDNYRSGVSPVMFIILRSVTTCLMHGMLVAIIGYGIQIVRRVRTLILPVLFGLFALAVTLYALYNLCINSNVRFVGMLMPILLYLAGMLVMKDEPAQASKPENLKEEL
ncbi:MAG TPA: PrsW family glutamic-type intramembrane protease [Clostridia bacterium]|nr:PrsW family glutamic-type intramembrane protease [Clostridia bacterium]